MSPKEKEARELNLGYEAHQQTKRYNNCHKGIEEEESMAMWLLALGLKFCNSWFST